VFLPFGRQEAGHVEVVVQSPFDHDICEKKVVIPRMTSRRLYSGRRKMNICGKTSGAGGEREKNAGISYDIYENKGRKTRVLGISYDVADNKGT